MTNKVKELEEKLAAARKEEVKKEGLTLVVFEEDLENLKEIKVFPHDLTDKEKAEIMQSASRISDNLDEIQKITQTLDTTVGPWLKLMALTEAPLKEILACLFRVDAAIVATLPNLDVLGIVFQENPWINSKAKNLATELDFIAKKKSTVVMNDDGGKGTWQHQE